jgi:hypothetical protein
MKMLSYVILIVMLLSLGAPLVGAQETSDPWGDPVATGIEYREYQLPDPVNVFVTRMDRSNLQVTLESSIGQGRLSGGLETVSSMAQRYNGAINYWGNEWGNTNEVVVAINGYYFDYGSGIPRQGQVHSGWYAKLFDPCESGTGGSGFAWNLNRDTFIGESVRNAVREIHYVKLEEQQKFTHVEKELNTTSENNRVFIPVVSKSFGKLPEPKQVFDGINKIRGDDQLILFTPQYGVNTGTSSNDSLEVLIRMTSPTLIRDVKDFENLPNGIIEQIFVNRGSTKIPFGHVVLSMHGSKKDDFMAIGAKKGDEVKILQIIRECNNSPRYYWEDTYASIGGAFYFLKDGVINDFSDKGEAKVRDPRTAVVYNDDYIYFVVVDGRDAWHSKGMTIKELGEFARDELGATYGIAEDGGGSSTMVVNGEVKNNTYCNIVICKGELFLPLVYNKPSGENQETGSPMVKNRDGEPTSVLNQPETLSGDGLPLTEEYYTFSPDATGDILQRLVANGMMMVVVESRDISPIFTEGEAIRTNSQVNVRLGPGTNYGLIESVDANTTGIIYGKDNGLNGVWAKGYYWWHVLLEVGERDVIGWVIEPNITKTAQ